MGFLTNLIDDAADAVGAVVRAPMRITCAAMGGHAFLWDRKRGEYVCEVCEATKKGPEK